MKIHTPITILMLSVTAPLQGADTPEFDRLRDSYKAAMEKATKPINQTYLAELVKLRDMYARAAKLDAANKVQAELDAIAGETGGPNAGKLVPQPTISSNGPETPVAIPANDVNGFKIGPLKKGDTITLSYVTGKWKNDGVLPSDNPDAQFTERGDLTRLVIANGRYKTKPGPVLVMVPPGTATTPFSYTLQDDVDNVVLRINEDSSDYETNPGVVTYKLKISH